MSGYIPLHELLMQRDPSAIFAYRKERLVRWKEFMGHVNFLLSRLKDGSRWVLVCDDTYWFAVGFFALLHAGKKVVLPANGLPQTLNELPEPISGILTDKKKLTDFSAIYLPNIEEQKIEQGIKEHKFIGLNTDQTCIELFTSGSSGRPKKIDKNIGNLLSEIECLERLWGNSINKTVTLATVSHQHIYGLLFRLLWPVCTGRAFVSTSFEYPEVLLAHVQKLDKESCKTVLISSPAHLKRMSQLINVNDLKFGLKKIFSSGGPLTKEIAGEFEQRFEQSPIEVFGSTETGGVAYRQQCSKNEISYWKTFDTVEIKTGEPDDVLMVQSPYISKEKDQWFAMGDKVEILANQLFILHGRVDRIVKFEEKRLSLSEMELYLKNSVWVEDVRILVISGERDKMGGVIVLTERGKIFLLKNGRLAMSVKLRQILSSNYEAVVLPRKWRYVTELPINSQGKATQFNLEELFS